MSSKTQTTRIQFYRDARNKFRWRIVARNGQIIGASTQGYASKRRMRTNCAEVQRALDHAATNAYIMLDTPEFRFSIEDRTGPEFEAGVF